MVLFTTDEVYFSFLDAIFFMKSYLVIKNERNVCDIEDLLDGNICRCTGYRPILDAFKTFGTDVSKDLQNCLAKTSTLAQKDYFQCGIYEGFVGVSTNTKNVFWHKTANRTNWYWPSTSNEVMQILSVLPQNRSYRIVAGNTGIFHE